MMNTFNLTRRGFIACAAANSVTASLVARERKVDESSLAGRVKKAVKFHMVNEDLSVHDKFLLLKDLGFDGVEPRAAVAADQKQFVRDLASATEKTGLPIHGVVHSSNPNIEDAIDQARHLGADSVLHVVRYDRKISYQENHQNTSAILRRGAAHAEKQKVRILIENVWATFLIEPTAMRDYVDAIQSDWVQVYFDVGNVVRWGWPQHWIEVLGRRIRKLDIKEYDLNVAMNDGMRKGFSVPIGEGSVEWAKVRTELLKIDFRGWATAEVKGGDRARLAEIRKQMDRVVTNG